MKRNILQGTRLVAKRKHSESRKTPTCPVCVTPRYSHGSSCLYLFYVPRSGANRSHALDQQIYQSHHSQLRRRDTIGGQRYLYIGIFLWARAPLVSIESITVVSIESTRWLTKYGVTCDVTRQEMQTQEFLWERARKVKIFTFYFQLFQTSSYQSCFLVTCRPNAGVLAIQHGAINLEAVDWRRL